MKTNASTPTEKLRSRAEARLRKRDSKQRPADDREAGAEKLRLLHELQVHQVELEAQNEELQEARCRLQALLEKFIDLYDFSPVGYCTLNEQGRMLELNLTCAAILGAERSRLINRHLQEFVVPNSRPVFLSFIQEIFAGEDKKACVAELRNEGRAAFWAHLQGVRETSPAGMSTCCRITLADITAVKQAEEAQRRAEVLSAANEELKKEIVQRRELEKALRQSEERFRQIAEISGEFIWEVDPMGLYTYASPSAEKILGYSPEELVGKKHFYDLFIPSLREELKATTLHVLANRQTFRNFPNTNVSKSGRVVYLETSGTPMLDGSGNLVGYRGADTNVTGRRQSEMEIEQQRNELAHFSRVNMLGELAGSLAHELNQPLTAILSNAQAAQRFLANDRVDINEMREILADIVAEDKRAGEVIRRLRALLKKGEVSHQPLNLNDVVQEVLKLVRNDLMNHGVDAHTELAPDPPVLRGDRVQLQQVLLNLVINACDAMVEAAPHERQLTIRTSPGGDGSVHLSVVDNGTGIALEKLDQVFEPFYTTRSHGLGLGLSVCRTIVTAHGGSLWATNNPERGATFHVALPLNAVSTNLDRRPS